MSTDAPMRLNKFIAHTAGLSRREADTAIEQGRVRVNQSIARLGQTVSVDDLVTLDQTPLARTQSYTYLLLHKPVGYVCSRRAQGDSQTIYSLLPERYHALKSVGRLDRDSSGLLLLTDDGDFAHRMTHPSFHKTKTYQVQLDQPLSPLHQQMISDHGVLLEDGVSRFTVTSHEEGGYGIQMSEGRNRQIRRTFAALGYSVKKLHRVQFGNYSLMDLTPGTYQEVNP